MGHRTQRLATCAFVFPRRHVAGTPLRRSERRLVALNLVMSLAGIALLILVLGGDVAVLGCAVLATGALH